MRRVSRKGWKLVWADEFDGNAVDLDRTLVAERVAEFRDQVGRRIAGALTEAGALKLIDIKQGAFDAGAARSCKVLGGPSGTGDADPTVLDIADNPHGFELIETAPESLVRSLEDVDLAVIAEQPE